MSVGCMAILAPTTFRFYARSSCHSRVIHFTTTSPSLIAYFTSGYGGATSMAPYTLLSDHSATIPQNVDWYLSNQNEFAMLYAPFFRSGIAHWDINLGGRWCVQKKA